jgi:transmembrane sensor
MMLDRAIEDARQRPVPWDDLRERRVLAQLQARAAVGARRAQAPRWRLPATALAGLAAAVLMVFGALALWPGTPERGALPLALAATEATAAPVPSATPVIPHVDPARLMLADGSSAQLGRAAHVQVVEQTDHQVRLDQSSGRVRYDVTPNASRRFVVEAHGVQVRVVGTVFSVDVSDPEVAVSVERGIVEVEAGERVVRLVAGDSVRMPWAEVDEILIDAPVPATPPRTAPAPRPTVEALLAEADDARAHGDSATAASALQRLVAGFPKDPRAISAYFQLGKVERARGRHAAAARAFERCVRRSPDGALAEDARAEAALSWRTAGDDDEARVAARAYLDRYPAGAHARRMQRLAEDAP